MKAKGNKTNASSDDVSTPSGPGLYIVLISIHGLVRGDNMELGRDADTGGQIKYVVELARALAAHPAVDRVDLLTRQVFDSKVDSSYGESLEPLAENAFIVRLPCGPRRYLRKEVLWPHLDSFSDHALLHIRSLGRVPDLIHAHYADAGYVGTRLAALLGTPLVFTGHSLGRVKRARLLERGLKEETIEAQYNLSQRIEAEETALDYAAFVVASTSQEVEEQYAIYDNYQTRRIKVIAPGIDLSRFSTPVRFRSNPPIKTAIEHFLTRPRLPMILALSRADERKNIAGLIRAYAQHPQLRDIANLVIIAGCRDDIQVMEKAQREVFHNIFYLIDRYDLYGSIALPKQHSPDEVPLIYQVAAQTKGVFVNPALTEPFGLTLLEAAASGLPVIATHDGGPRDILAHCKNGKLVDPLDITAMGNAIYEALSNRGQWRKWKKSGVQSVYQHYTWQGHVEKYLTQLEKVIHRKTRARVPPPRKSRLPTVDHIIVCDVDNTLLGDREGLQILIDHISQAHVAFGVATGRNLKSTLKVLKEWQVPVPDLLITSVGSEIHYGHRMINDSGWQKHSQYRWSREKVVKAMMTIPGLRMQPEEQQLKHKISYFVDPDKAPSVREIVRHLRRLDLHVNAIYSHQAYLDLMPIRVSKGMALRYVGMKWGFNPENCLVAGDSGNDADMLLGDTLGVVVGNYSSELKRLQGEPRIYFAKGEYAWGVMEGLQHYNFIK